MVVVRDETYGKTHLIIGGANTALRYISPRGELHTVLFIIMAGMVFEEDGGIRSECKDFPAALDDIRAVIGQNDLLHDWPLMRYIERHEGLTLHLCTDAEWDIGYYENQRTGRKAKYIALDADYIDDSKFHGMTPTVEEFLAQIPGGLKHNAYRKDFPDVSMGHDET